MTISDKNTRVPVTMPKELKNKLKTICKPNNRTLSNLIVYICEKSEYSSQPKGRTVLIQSILLLTLIYKINYKLQHLIYYINYH